MPKIPVLGNSNLGQTREMGRQVLARYYSNYGNTHVRELLRFMTPENVRHKKNRSNYSSENRKFLSCSVVKRRRKMDTSMNIHRGRYLGIVSSIHSMLGSVQNGYSGLSDIHACHLGTICFLSRTGVIAATKYKNLDSDAPVV